MSITQFKRTQKFNDLLTHVNSEIDSDSDMRLTVCEFVDLNKNVENSDTVSQDGIIESITGKPSDDDSCDQSETLLAPLPPTDSQSQIALETGIRFFESQIQLGSRT